MKRELRCSALLGGCALLGVCIPLALMQGWPWAGRWLLTSLLLWVLVWMQAWRRRDLNRLSPESPPYPDLGLANHLTLLRGWLIAATGGFLLLPGIDGFIAWIPAALYSVAAILDRIDGHLARRNSRISLLGSELDTVFDALGLLMAPLLAVLLGKVHVSYLLVSVAYYVFIAGIRWRRAHGLPVHPLAPSPLRRALAGFQMGYVAVVLWPPFDAQVTVPAGFGFMVPVLAGFVVDWLVVSGRIDHRKPSVAAWFSRFHSLSDSVLQPLLRVIATVAIFILAPLPNSFMADSLWLAAILLILGIGGRLAALAVLVLLARQFPVASVGPVGLMALFAATGILLLGCGRFSLWQGDDRWVNDGNNA
ncbi:MAG: hypothetical protein RLZZ385_2391 [Pseudomonadota bacterium]|jgi:CDP-diacylglycerol--glycerol-3-phosphate 3-phosphatidyltransferase